MKNVIWEPEMSESIYEELRLELRRFPYLSDKNRNDAEIDRLISNLFNSPTSLSLAYDGGYLIFRNIDRCSADLFWIHFPGKKFGHSQVKTAREIVDASGGSMGIGLVTMRTASPDVLRLAQRLGFCVDRIEPKGFEWYGRKMPMFHLLKEV